MVLFVVIALFLAFCSLLVLIYGFCLFYSIVPFVVGGFCLWVHCCFNGGFCLFYSIVPSVVGGFCPGSSLLLMAVSACFIALSLLLADSPCCFNGGFCLFYSIVPSVVGGFCLCSVS
jgi:hypothetical protein